ncbi:hypothetical protein YQE_09960, partial [Dendroctonus ponderosae]
MYPEPYNSVEAVKKICVNFEHIRRVDLDRVLRLLRVEKNVAIVDQCSLYMISFIAEILTKDNYANNREVYDACKNLLDFLAEKSNSEITGYQLTNLLQSADRDETFIITLQALGPTMCKHHHQSFESWRSRSFSIIRRYLEEVDVPNQDPKKIIDLYKAIVKFYETTIDGTKNPELLKGMIPHLIQLLGNPLCFTQDASSKSLDIEFGKVMQKTVANIFRTMDDPLGFLQHPPYMRFHPDELAIAHLFYWVYCEGVCLQAVPKVYSPKFVFELSVALMCALLESEHDGLVEKAIKLASRLLIPLKEEKWSHLLLELESTGQFISLLATTIVYNNTREIRQMALTCLTTFILQFDTTGVYLILKHSLAVQSHSGLKGYLITLYKDLIHREWGDDISEYLKGVHLKRFLSACCRLKGDEDSNLSEDSEQIISALNLIRYLLLKDQNNVTQVANWLALLEDSYLKPLKKSITLSRNRLEQDIRTPIDDQTMPKGELNLMVAGEKVEPSSEEERLASLKSSLAGLDVIESVLSRVVELLEEK